MVRELSLRQPVPGDPAPLRARFVDDPEEWLPEPARWRGRRTWTVTLAAGPANRTVNCKVGPVWSIGMERWRSLTWVPAPERGDLLPIDRGLPTLRGELGLVEDDGKAALELRALYYPPAGMLGGLADATGLGRIARRTVERFLEQVAAGLARDR